MSFNIHAMPVGLRRAAAFQEGTADVAVKASSAYAVLP